MARTVAARAVDACKTYGRGDTAVAAIAGISIELHAERFTAVMGPSGSGKSTLLHCLAGLDTLTSGSMFLGDTEISHLGEKELTLLRRDHVGFVFQAFNLVPTLSALENITLPMRLGGRTPDEGWLNRVVRTLGLENRLDHRPSELSGGQQQRVAVARAMAGRPRIIFADEPTGNLDSRSGAEVIGLLRGAVDDFAQTIVMVTHDPGAACRADRVIFLADGAVVGDLDEPTSDGVIERLRMFGP